MEWIHVIPPPRLDWECWTWKIFKSQDEESWGANEARRAAAKYDKVASYIAAAMKILAEDSEDDTDHEDTPTPPAFTVQLFLDSYFLISLLFSMEKWTKNNENFNQKMSESRNSCRLIVGGVGVEGMMTPGKIGALVWGWKKGQHI